MGKAKAELVKTKAELHRANDKIRMLEGEIESLKRENANAKVCSRHERARTRAYYLVHPHSPLRLKLTSMPPPPCCCVFCNVCMRAPATSPATPRRNSESWSTRTRSSLRTRTWLTRCRNNMTRATTRLSRPFKNSKACARVALRQAQARFLAVQGSSHSFAL